MDEQPNHPLPEEKLYPSEVAFLAIETAERISIEMNAMFNRLAEHRDIHKFADECSTISQIVADAIMADRSARADGAS